MSKQLKISILYILTIIIFTCPTYATNTTENLTNTSSETAVTSSVSNNQNSSKSYYRLSESDLRTNNIICILLDVFGFLLIILGIAILIRLKR